MAQPFGDHITEIDLGQHTLILSPSGNIELFAEPGNGVDLDSDETYRLYISLHARFQPPAPEEEEEEPWD